MEVTVAQVQLPVRASVIDGHCKQPRGSKPGPARYDMSDDVASGRSSLLAKNCSRHRWLDGR